MQEVEYRLLPDTQFYRIGTDGSVWFIRARGAGLLSEWRQKAVTFNPKNGYAQVALYINGRRKTFAVHRLMALTFLGARPEGMEVCHNDGNKFNNRLDNIRYDTRIANIADKLRHGTHNRGEQHNLAELTREQVIEIRRLRATGVSDRELAAKFGVVEKHINEICRGKSWAWLEEGIIRGPRITANTRGEGNYNAKLNVEKVRQVRRLASEGVPTKEIAAAVGVAPPTVYKVLSGRSWAHVT